VESIYGLNGISTISHITYDDCTCEIKKVNRLSGCPPSDQINNRVANISRVFEPSRDGADIVHVVGQDPSGRWRIHETGRWLPGVSRDPQKHFLRYKKTCSAFIDFQYSERPAGGKLPLRVHSLTALRSFQYSRSKEERVVQVHAAVFIHPAQVFIGTKCNLAINLAAFKFHMPHVLIRTETAFCKPYLFTRSTLPMRSSSPGSERYTSPFSFRLPKSLSGLPGWWR